MKLIRTRYNAEKQISEWSLYNSEEDARFIFNPDEKNWGEWEEYNPKFLEERSYYVYFPLIFSVFYPIISIIMTVLLAALWSR